MYSAPTLILAERGVNPDHSKHEAPKISKAALASPQRISEMQPLTERHDAEEPSDDKAPPKRQPRPPRR
jgi:hypothetical protein